MGCQNQCKKYKAPKPRGGSRYANGQKYCTHCGVFMETKNRNCPCCNYQLKVSPSSGKHKLQVKRI